jgi:hypothetical protein
MCICVNCTYVDRCTTYHAVEQQHQQPHLCDRPDFEPVAPDINVNIRTRSAVEQALEDGDLGGGLAIEMEWDVVGCQSFSADMGKWARLRPGELVPT